MHIWPLLVILLTKNLLFQGVLQVLFARDRVTLIAVENT